MFCTRVIWVNTPIAKVKKKLGFLGTEEFQFKLSRNSHFCGLAPSMTFTFLWGGKFGQAVVLQDLSNMPPLLPEGVCDLYRCALHLKVHWCAEEEAPYFHHQPHPYPHLFSLLNEAGLLCFLCSLLLVTGAEWLLKMREDEECEEGSFCLWSEPDGEWWKTHGLWKSPVQLSVYRAP